jgi:hypothetical protein
MAYGNGGESAAGGVSVSKKAVAKEYGENERRNGGKWQWQRQYGVSIMAWRKIISMIMAKRSGGGWRRRRKKQL